MSQEATKLKTLKDGTKMKDRHYQIPMPLRDADLKLPNNRFQSSELAKKVQQQKMPLLKSIILLAIFKCFWQICDALNCGYIGTLASSPVTI